MAETYPASISTFKVVGRLIRGVGDSNDVGQDPDVVPLANAEIIFTPQVSPPVIRVPGATPPVTIFLESIAATTDENGYLKVAGDSSLGVVLPYGGDPDMEPSGWTWGVLINVGGTFPPRTFNVMGVAGGILDLSNLVPVASSPGQEVVQWQAAVTATQTARDLALGYRNEAETFKNQAAQAKNDAVAVLDMMLVSAQANVSGVLTLTQAQTKGYYLKRRLTGNLQLKLANGVSGWAYGCTLELQQDTTGGRTLTIENVLAPEGVVVPLSAQAGAIDLVQLIWNGNQWFAMLAGNRFAIPTAWVVP